MMAIQNINESLNAFKTISVKLQNKEKPQDNEIKDFIDAFKYIQGHKDELSLTGQNNFSELEKVNPTIDKGIVASLLQPGSQLEGFLQKILRSEEGKFKVSGKGESPGAHR